MSGFDGNGNYIRYFNWTQDALNSIPITASRFDTEHNGFATALTNCITRDGQGKPTADISWQSHGITNLRDPVATQEPITLGFLNGTSGLNYLQSTQLRYIQTAAEITASVTPVNYFYPAGHTYRYGTNTTPGTTDMTTAIQAAINQSAQVGGSAAYLPQGNHKTTTTLSLLRYCRFYGDGYFSQITYTGAGVAVQAIGASNPDVWRRGSIANMRIFTASGTHGVRVKDIAEFEISQNLIEGFTTAGIHLTGTGGSACINIWILSNLVLSNGKGLLADGVNNINQIAIHHNQFEGNTAAGISFEAAGKGISIVGNDIEGNGGTAELYMNGGNVSGVDISGNSFETANNHPLILIGDTVAAWGISIKGNQIQADTAITNGIMLGAAGGAVIGVDIAGNAFSGTMTNAINANQVNGGRFGPDQAAGIVHLAVGATSTGITEYGLNGPVTNVGGRTGAQVPLAYSATIATNAALAEVFSISVTNTSAFTVSTPTNLLTGMFITYEIINSSGGAMGAITWTGFKLSGAFTNPAANNIRFITFFYDGGSLREISRTAADQAV